MKKLIISVFIISLFITSLLVYAREEEEVWQLVIKDGEREVKFTLPALKELPSTEIEYTSKKTEKVNSYRGVILKILLEEAEADIEKLKGVEVEAGDLYMAKYNREQALKDSTVLAYEMDGCPLTEKMGTVRLLSPGEESGLQVKDVIRLIIKYR